MYGLSPLVQHTPHCNVPLLHISLPVLHCSHFRLTTPRITSGLHTEVLERCDSTPAREAHDICLLLFLCADLQHLEVGGGGG